MFGFRKPEYMEVAVKTDVLRGCINCLYRGSDGLRCGHAANRGLLMRLITGGLACPHFWLDHNKFPDAKSNW